MPANLPPFSSSSHHVPRERAGRVMLIGPPNAGKSTLLAAFTNQSIRHLKSLLVATKLGALRAEGRLDVPMERFTPQFAVVSLSAQVGLGLETLRAATYDLGDVRRLFTKVPGKSTDRTGPFTLPICSMVQDSAWHFHRGLERSLKFVRVWAIGNRDGECVQSDHDRNKAELLALYGS